MRITEEKFVSIIIQFFKERKNLSFYALAEKIKVDQKSIKDWYMLQRKSIRSDSIKQLIVHLQNDISSDFEEFSEFAVEELDKEGISREYTWKIFSSNDKDISTIKEQLLKLDIPEQKYLQEKIGTANIIRILKSFLIMYREYFQIIEKNIGEGDVEFVYRRLIYSDKQSKDLKKYVPDLNYLVVRFPNAYYVGVILSNYVIDWYDKDAYDYYLFMIEKLKNQNDLKMLLFFTDIDKKRVPFEIQSLLMEKYNLFFEFVSEMDLQKISIQGLEFQEGNGFELSKVVEQHRYAQLIFERFMSYLSVISNELIFMPYLKKLNKELDQDDVEEMHKTLNKILPSYQKRTNIKNFTYYANEVMLKGICRYSYLSRHTIYYERTLVSKEAGKTEKIPLAIEICAPNSLTTCDIIDKCERLLLFTTSHSAYSLMEKLEEKTCHKFLPSNVSLRLCHLNPEYMMHQYPEELNGKVDFLVIGYGAGSQISDLTRFVRYAYNWLSPNGILFMSVYNKEAIILNKNRINDQRFESSPLYLSDYWTYTLNEHPPFLKKIKAYSPESLRTAYLAFFGAENINLSTYPYISALINPSEYSRLILDEIREADKDFAKKGIHGQLIDAIVYKKEFVEKSDAKIRDYLADFNIQYNNYMHTLAPDSKSLKQSLQEKHVPLSSATLLKTVVLQKKNPTPSTVNCWSYAILPYNEMAVYDRMKFELASESFVIKKFNQGTISPLTVFAQRASNQNFNENIFLQYKDRINTEYVIMSGNSNTESIRIKTSDFIKMAINANVIFQNIIE